MNKLELAMNLAKESHKGQLDKSGAPYINHPRFVAGSVRGKSTTIVAILHDVFEDTDIKIKDVSFLNKNERIALELLTKKKGQDYMEYIRNIKKNKIARKVKIADLIHNMTDRGWRIPDKLLEKYKKAYNLLIDD